MEAKFIQLDGISKKYIINSSCVSSVHEQNHNGIEYLSIKMSDGSEVDVVMSILKFYELLNE